MQSLLQIIRRQYCGNLEQETVQRRQRRKNAPNSEIYEAQDKCFLWMDEAHGTWNVDDIKKYTGLGTFGTRETYGKKIKQAAMKAGIFCTANVLPLIPEADNAFWRRSRVIEFKSKFPEECLVADENARCYPCDTTLFTDTARWRMPFIHIVLE